MLDKLGRMILQLPFRRSLSKTEFSNLLVDDPQCLHFIFPSLQDSLSLENKKKKKKKKLIKMSPSFPIFIRQASTFTAFDVGLSIANEEIPSFRRGASSLFRRIFYGNNKGTSF